MSDAVVLVVSEETGQISLVYDGEIKRDINPDNLKLILNEQLGEDDKHTLWWQR